MTNINVVLGGQQGPSGPSGIAIGGVVADATTARTLQITDAEKLVEMSSASPNLVTVPPNSAAPFPVNTQIGICQAGAGQTTIAAGVGVTIKKRFTLKLAAQEAVATLIKVGTDTWRLVGDTADV